MPKKNSHPRLPRYRRADSPPILLDTENNLRFLELFQKYRFLDSNQTLALSWINRENTYIKLQKLYHNGLLQRFFFTPPSTGTSKIVSALDRKGAQRLQAQYPERYDEFLYSRGKRSQMFLAHTLMINNFRISLELALAGKKKIWVAGWRYEHSVRELFLGLKNERLVPDGYFAIQTRKGKRHYFLEADRGTIPLSRFAEKVKRYRKFFRSNRQELPRRFRVLTVANSLQRAKNLRMVTVRSDPEKKGSDRFWFCCEKQFSLDNPSALLEPIYIVGLKGAETRREKI